MSCSPLEKMMTKELEDEINRIIKEWRDETEDLTVIKKLKEWTK